ncbi:MAG TPA: HAMP domain-containing sensor histidine kinase [Thermosynechococcaceae cyanobacterium]
MQTLQLPAQINLRTDVSVSSLQSSLERFAQQFSLTGCCILQFRDSEQKPQPIAYWSDSLSPGLLSLIKAISRQDFTSELFEVVPIKTQDSSEAYGCLLKRTPDACDYLICWQSASLLKHQQLGHQQYGIELFAKSLSLQSSALSSRGQASTLERLQQARHQLRTPLALILLYADLLKTTALDSRSQGWLEHLQTAAEGMNTSLKHLTTWDASGDRALSHCNLQESLEECGREMQPWIEEKQLKLVLDPHSLWLRVDEWKMKQVFQNLLSNAIAFSPQAGQITWEWQTFQTEVLIKISDQGPGLSAEDLRSIGTPFYSRRQGGTGLGLSIAKQVILEHQGSLWAVNLPCGGAQFCITLPRT